MCSYGCVNTESHVTHLIRFQSRNSLFFIIVETAWASRITKCPTRRSHMTALIWWELLHLNVHISSFLTTVIKPVSSSQCDCQCSSLSHDCSYCSTLTSDASGDHISTFHLLHLCFPFIITALYTFLDPLLDSHFLSLL